MSFEENVRSLNFSFLLIKDSHASSKGEKATTRTSSCKYELQVDLRKRLETYSNFFFVAAVDRWLVATERATWCDVSYFLSQEPPYRFAVDGDRFNAIPCVCWSRIQTNTSEWGRTITCRLLNIWLWTFSWVLVLLRHALWLQLTKKQKFWTLTRLCFHVLHYPTYFVLLSEWKSHRYKTTTLYSSLIYFTRTQFTFVQIGIFFIQLWVWGGALRVPAANGHSLYCRAWTLTYPPSNALLTTEYSGTRILAGYPDTWQVSEMFSAHISGTKSSVWMKDSSYYCWIPK